MRKNNCYLIGVFIIILLFSSIVFQCRILKKDLSHEKTELNQIENSDLKTEGSKSEKVEFNQEIKSTYDFSNVRFTDFIRLNYQPLFDAEGKIIPLIFRQTINGKTDEIFLSGGNFIQEKSSSSEVENEVKSNKKSIDYQTEKKYLIHTTYKSLYRIKTKEITKIKSVWGFDLNFWTGLTIVLQLLIFGIIIYKLPKNSIKLFWDRIWKNNPPTI
ncbi:hypothetical protein [Empedobacter tilapiae]